MSNQKGNALIIGILIGVILTSGLFGAYYLSTRKTSTQAANQKPLEKMLATSIKVETGNVTSNPSPAVLNTSFNFQKLKAGDKIGFMVVKKVEPFDSRLSGLAKDNFKITFSGQLKISGEYLITDGSEPGIGMKFVTFTPDSSSLSLLPKEENASQYGYSKSFVFNDYEKAVKALTSKGKNGIATVTIDNYTLVSYPSEVNNSADLIQVH